MQLFRLFSLCLLCLTLSSGKVFGEESFSYFGDSAKPKVNVPELNIKRIFVLPGKDDVNGALAPELDRAVLAHIDSSSRFELIRNSEVVRALKMDERGYGRIANSEQVHSKAAQITGADATIILESKHLGTEIQIREDWRRPDGSLLFTETQSIKANSGIDSQRKLVSKMTKSIESRIPFSGSVTGVDGRTVTLDLNKDYVRVGDRVDFVRLIGTKRHPLLKTLVDAEYVKVAEGEITSVDPVLSFARIINISPGEQVDTTTKIGRLNSTYKPAKRVREAPVVAPRVEPPKQDPFAVKEPNPTDPLMKTENDRLSLEKDSFVGRYGKAGVRLNVANLSHSQTNGATDTDISGWGVGAGLLGEIWITKEWLIGFSYDFSNAGLSGQRGSTEIAANGTSWNRFRFYGGYRYLLEGSLDKMFLTFSLGYQGINMNLPTDATNQLGQKNFSGMLIGIQMDYPMDPKSWIVASIGLSPFGTFDESGVSLGETDGSTTVSAAVGYHIQWKRQFWITFDIHFDSSSASYENGINLTDRRFSISPGLIYRF